MYTIGQVSQQFNISVSTLRYYDKEGLLPQLKRVSGIRYFSEKDLEALRVIECLKRSGLEIKTICQFMKWCELGNETLPKRKELFEKQKRVVEEEMKQLQKVYEMISYKCWYYGESVKLGSEEYVTPKIPEGLPIHIKKSYDAAHQ
ncbi:MerR family transcriptional regulator [Holzapfeliella sp. He02]|uniref:MerR family transcriptional regulator n=1 Tax=Holzapfeliella saturejae TaxID=3082953 RepID=A0ABU8SGI1_9LACO